MSLQLDSTKLPSFSFGDLSFADISPESEDWLLNLLEVSINNRASDIHFEPTMKDFIIRIRIDGLLHLLGKLPRLFHEKTISRIKVLAQINIAEHRTPQDGHFEVRVNDKLYSIRVSTLPTIYGESVVLRILNKEDLVIKLEELGFEDDQLVFVNQLITIPAGMILTTGPMGSGKTTLLYSLLNVLSRPEKSVLTLEDPVEYQMPDIRQSQVNETAGFTFARAMRSIVRQDPNIVLVGEIRDEETAHMAMQAALTGVLVLSTFHTFDVPALVNRFKEMGVSTSIITQAIQGVIFTRLVRTICTQCKISYEPSEYDRRMLGERTPSALFKGKGCNNCNNIGYIGRTGVFEIVYFDHDIRSAIIENRPASYIYDILAHKKVKSLKESCVNKILDGKTTTSEVLRVLGMVPFSLQAHP